MFMYKLKSAENLRFQSVNDHLVMKEKLDYLLKQFWSPHN